MADYVERGGILIPSTVSAAWQDGQEIFEYFTGKIDDIT